MIGSVLRVRYELTQLLVEGPIFVAYSARDRIQGREVCVRLLKPPYSSEQAFVDKLIPVIKRYSGSHHPGIEPIYELDEDEAQPFLVGRLTRGTTLCERIQKLAPLSVPVSVATAISMLEALDSLHSAGLVHGDVSGSNTIIVADGTACLQMAGIWEAYSASQTAGFAVLPAMAPYLAPEISAGAQPSFSSDVYAVGIILFELLTGRKPYVGDTPVSVAMKHAGAGVPNVRMFNPSTPNVLEEIAKKGMAKDPAARYQTAGGMLSDLRMLQDAQRFGRSLTWPIRPAPTSVAQPVAPKMSAVREDLPVEVRQTKERGQRDVPVWIMLVAVSCLVAVVCAITALVAYQTIRPRDISVPNIKNMPTEEARTTLRGLHLGLRIKSKKPSDQYAADTIIDVQPPPGEKVREGNQLDVIVSSGSRFVEVPDLRGRTVDDAKSMLGALNLELDDLVDKVPSRSVDAGMIVSQIPNARKKVERFVKIRVKVSDGNTGPEPVPANSDAQTKYVYNLKIHLTDLKDTATVRVEITDSRGSRTVYEQEQLPDDTVDIQADGYGKEATFRIFYNNKLVKQVNQTGSSSDPSGDTGGQADGGNNG